MHKVHLQIHEQCTNRTYPSNEDHRASALMPWQICRTTGWDWVNVKPWMNRKPFTLCGGIINSSDLLAWCISKSIQEIQRNQRDLHRHSAKWYKFPEKIDQCSPLFDTNWGQNVVCWPPGGSHCVKDDATKRASLETSLPVTNNMQLRDCTAKSVWREVCDLSVQSSWSRWTIN